MSARAMRGPWTFWQGLGILTAFIAVYAALSAAHMFAVRSTIGFEAYLGDGPRFPPHMLIASQAIKAGAILAVIWLLALRLRGLDWKAVGFTPVRVGWLAASVGVALVGFSTSIFIAKSVVSAVPDWARFTASRYGWNDAPAWQMIVLLTLTVVITPIVEEIFFRGFLLRWMATHRPLWLAILVSSLMFGASHIVPPQAIVAAAMAVLISLLFVASRSLWPCILCHGVNNALGVSVGMAAEAGMLAAWLTPLG